jgi:zinc/manganese transport system substrate-binding protein
MSRDGWSLGVIGLSAVLTLSARGEESILRVVATHSILADWVRSVSGDGAVVTSLVGPDGDGHTYEPTPEDVRRVRDADVVFCTGAHFEPWLPGIQRAAGGKTLLVDLSSRVDLRDVRGRHGVGASMVPREVDPHYWNDVRNADRAVVAIAEALTSIRPAMSTRFQDRATAYRVRLASLDRWLDDQIGRVPVDRRKLVTAHDSMGYWADRAGFRVVGTALGALSTEASDPSARDIRRLLESIRAEKVPAIFVENIGGDRLVEQIAREAGVRLARKLHTDALSRPEGPVPTYVDLIRHNTQVIVESLAP